MQTISDEWKGCGIICRWWPKPSTAPSWCHGEAGIRLQSPSSHPSNPLRIVDQMARVWRVTGCECPLISCIMRLVNSCRICSDAHNIGFSPIQQKPIWFDTIHPVSVAIRYRSNNRPFSITDRYPNLLICANPQIEMLNIHFHLLHVTYSLHSSFCKRRWRLVWLW